MMYKSTIEKLMIFKRNIIDIFLKIVILNNSIKRIHLVEMMIEKINFELMLNRRLYLFH